MKKFLGMLGIVAAAVLPLTSQAAPTVFFKPGDQSVLTGAPVSLGVWISGLQSMNPSDVISAFDLNVHLSNTNLTFVDAIYSGGEPLGSTTGPDPMFPDAQFSFSVVDGQNIDVIGNSFIVDKSILEGLQSDEFLLFTLDFTAGGDNLSTLLTFTSDPKTVGMNVTGFEDYLRETSFGNACVRVGDTGDCGQSVPEPSSYALVAAALLAAGAVGRTRRRSRAAA